MAKTVLIVDDEPQAVGVFQTALSSAGYIAAVAPSGNKALETLKNQRIDIILLDEMMPDMSGNDLIKAVKQDPATKDIPIVILTNFGNEDLVKEAIAAGAKDYILKYQISPVDLAAKIKSMTGD